MNREESIKTIYKKIKNNFLCNNIKLKEENSKIIIPSLINYYLQGFYSFAEIAKLEKNGIQVEFNVEDNGHFSSNVKEVVVEQFILYLLNKLLFFNSKEIEEIVKKSCLNFEIIPANIPQFSNLKDGTINLIKILQNEESGIDSKKIGENLSLTPKNDVANRKYGENHVKLAVALDVAYLENRKYYLTALGKQMLCLPNDLQEELFDKVIFNIPIIKKYVVEEISYKNIDFLLANYLSESTAKRRSSNIRTLLTKALNIKNEI